MPMKVQVNSIAALITWFIKALRALNAVKDSNIAKKGKQALLVEPGHLIAALPNYDPRKVEVQGTLLWPVTHFMTQMETVLSELLADDKAYDTCQHDRQHKNQLRDKAVRALSQSGRYFFEGMKFRQEERGTEEGALIMNRLSVPPASSTSIDEITASIRKLIEAEKVLQSKGYRPIEAPTLESLQKLLDETIKILGQAQKATMDVLQAQQLRRQSAEQGRRLVRKLYKFLEFYYDDLPEEQRRTISKALGYIFTFTRNGEEPAVSGDDQPAQQDGTADTTEPALKEPTQPAVNAPDNPPDDLPDNLPDDRPDDLPDDDPFDDEIDVFSDIADDPEEVSIPSGIGEEDEPIPNRDS